MNSATLYLKQLNKKLKSFKRLRLFAWGVVAATGAVSVWGNLVHAESFDMVGRFISMLPPVLFIGAFELGSRIPIPKDAAWYKKWLRAGATAAVASIGAYLSYFHQRDAFAVHTAGDKATARLLPLSIDGLMIVGAVSLYELNRWISDLVDRIEVETARQESKDQRASGTPGILREPVTPGRETKRERVLNAISRTPDLTPEQVASMTGASVGYVNNLLSELRKANASELLPVS